MTTDTFRNPTAHERDLIRRLVQAEFQGVSEVRAQLESCEVRKIDPEGSLELRIKTPQRANVRFRVPVELLGKDSDDFGIHVLLHVVDGISTEIEIYKDTSTAILSWPSSWDVIVAGPE